MTEIKIEPLASPKQATSTPESSKETSSQGSSGLRPSRHSSKAKSPPPSQSSVAKYALLAQINSASIELISSVTVMI